MLKFIDNQSLLRKTVLLFATFIVPKLHLCRISYDQEVWNIPYSAAKQADLIQWGIVIHFRARYFANNSVLCDCIPLEEITIRKDKGEVCDA